MKEKERERERQKIFPLHNVFDLYPAKTEMGTVRGKGAAQNFSAVGGTCIYTMSNLTIY